MIGKHNHINKIVASRDYKYGADNPCYKPLTKEKVNTLKDLRFNQNKTIRECIKIMGINQKKYYEYINE